MSERGFEEGVELGDWRPFECRVIGWIREGDEVGGSVAVSLYGAVRVEFSASPAQARALAVVLGLAADAADLSTDDRELTS